MKVMRLGNDSAYIPRPASERSGWETVIGLRTRDGDPAACRRLGIDAFPRVHFEAISGGRPRSMRDGGTDVFRWRTAQARAPGVRPKDNTIAEQMGAR